MIKKNTLSIALLSTLALSAGSAQALQAGDMFMRFTATSVQPNDDSSAFNSAAVSALGLKPEVDNNTQLGATFVYMYSDNIGVEVLAATPFSHDISLDGIGKIAETKHLPPTVSAQYYFNPQSKVRPFVGIGLNYTIFFSEKATLTSPLDLQGDLKLDNSFGLALQAGIDYDIDDTWFLTADIRYINIETTATNSVAGSSNVDINPTVISVGAGFRF